MAHEADDRTPLLLLGDIAEPTYRLLAERRRVIRIEAKDATAASFAARGLASCDLVAAGDSAGPALRLALDVPSAVRALVLLGPTVIGADGAAGAGGDTALLARLGELAVPLLAAFGTRDAAAPPEAARHYRARVPACNLMLVYDATAAMTGERPEAVAALILDFLERHDHFLVRRESDRIYP
jgi:pimeloyl-ACP methyl ester carboxylesterase